MAQQINLYQPDLPVARVVFPAVALLRALAVLALAGAAGVGWALLHTAHLRRELVEAETRHAGERRALDAAIAGRPSLGQTQAALEQELLALQRAAEPRRQLLEELTRGRIVDGRSDSQRLHLIARTAPAALWIERISIAPHKLRVNGTTLDPAVLKPWMATLNADPLLESQQLTAIQVELAASAQVPAGTARWRFTLVSSGATPLAPATAAAATSQGDPR